MYFTRAPVFYTRNVVFYTNGNCVLVKIDYLLTDRICIKHKIMYVENIRVTDINTGEVCETRKIIAIKKAKGDSFFQMYADNLLYFLDIEPGTARKVAGYLFKEAKYDEGYVDISPYLRGKMLEELGITYETYRKCIKTLCEKEIIYNQGKGRYLINPNIAWRGSLESRELLKTRGLKLTLEPSDD